jgi:SNF2 family DNA or RNA helicase
MSRKGVTFGRRDSWDYSVLSKIIHDWLLNFKKNIEHNNLAGVPGYYIDTPDTTDEEWNEAFAKWLADLDLMIFAFSEEGEFTDSERTKQGRELFAKLYGSLWW